LETLIIHLTPVAFNRSSRGRALTSLLSLTLALAFTLLSPLAAQKTLGGSPIDLTTPEPANQQGLGVPGASGGTFESPKYELPLRAEIIQTSVSKAGDFILELQLENTGQGGFDLPISRNISDVQRTPGGSRREFFFQIRPVSSEGQPAEAVGFGVTAGSVAVPGSFMRLQPRESVRVLLRAESSRVRKAMPNESKQLEVRVVCGEWTLDDNRFFIRATAQDLISANAAALIFRDHMPVAVTQRSRQ
jgi:hypothetical protein